MRKPNVLLGIAAGLAGCGQSSGDSNAANGGANGAAPATPKPAYCFFQDSETKGWKAARDAQGNIVVKGKAYREDSRYQAVLTPPLVHGDTAEVSPTIQQNATPYGAAEGWWDVGATVPNSSGVEAVNVTCGGKVIAKLTIPPQK